MNPVIHAEISVKRRKGNTEDYLDIHAFADSSKTVESSNKHRVFFHTPWGINNVIIPIFGASFKNSNNLRVMTLPLMLEDHVLPDYKNKFVPCLSDFCAAVEDDPTDADYIKTFHEENKQFFEENPEIHRLMISPLANTGAIKSLLITHSSWFTLEILPRIFKTKIELKDYNIAPSRFFNRMKFQKWMDNGRGLPPSALNTVK